MAVDATPRVALCGAGLISMAHAAAARFNGFELVAVASRSAARTAEQAERLGTRGVTYADLPGNAEIVVVATPPGSHAADTIRLLAAGAAVLVEKPLCRTLAEADAMVAAAETHGQRALYGENLLYAPAVQAFVERVAKVGRLTHLEARALQALPTWGDFTTEGWGGGVLFDLGVHPLAIVLVAAAACGEGRPVAVSAQLRGGAGHASDEHADVRLRFGSGLTARVEASWQGPTDPVWDVQAASATGVVRLEVMPTPVLEHDGETVSVPATGVALPAVAQFGYLAQLRALADDTRRRATPLMSVAFGRDVLQVVCAAYTSASRGGADVALPFAGRRDLTPLQLWRGEG